MFLHGGGLFVELHGDVVEARLQGDPRFEGVVGFVDGRGIGCSGGGVGVVVGGEPDAVVEVGVLREGKALE